MALGLAASCSIAGEPVGQRSVQQLLVDGLEALGDERNGGSSGKQPQDFCLARRELAYARAFGSGSAVGS